MLRDALSENLHYDEEFRWRGTNVSRIENLSDIVFAIAFGMAVSAITPPQSYNGLIDIIWNVIPVGAAFTILITIWHYHYKFFRRVGVLTPRILWLNGVLLFTILYVAYPLRFSFEGFFAFLEGTAGKPERIIEMQLDWARSGIIMAFFAAGFGMAHLILAIMQAHALTLSDRLDFSVREKQLIASDRYFHLGFALNAALITALALFTPLYGMAGFLFWLSWPIGYWAEKRASRTYPLTAESEPKPA